MQAPVNPVPYPIVESGSDTIWTITGSELVRGPEVITAVLSADGVPTAPTSWYLEGPSGNDESALVVGAGDTVTFMPQYTATEPRPYGTWQLKARDGSSNDLAICVVTMQIRQTDGIAPEPYNYIVT